MNQITIAIPLDEIPDGMLPRELIRKAPVMRFLRCDIDGFILTCHVPTSELNDLIKVMRKNYRQLRISSEGLARDGSAIIRVSGEWWRKVNATEYPRQAQVIRMLKALGQTQCYLLRSPEVSGQHLRVTLVGDSGAIKRLHKTFEKMGVRYDVTKLSKSDEGADFPVDQLTTQQLRILRLAHSLGYYDVPRKVGTEHVARLLKMNKGTVGEHLRRAERHVMDSLLS